MARKDPKPPAERGARRLHEGPRAEDGGGDGHGTFWERAGGV